MGCHVEGVYYNLKKDDLERQDYEDYTDEALDNYYDPVCSEVSMCEGLNGSSCMDDKTVEIGGRIEHVGMGVVGGKDGKEGDEGGEGREEGVVEGDGGEKMKEVNRKYAKCLQEMAGQLCKVVMMHEVRTLLECLKLI